MNLDQRLADELEHRRQQRLYRKRRILQSPQGAEIVIDGRHCVSFCSNDYLGLANHPLVIKALQDGAARYGVGSGASHLITGHSAAH
ncbi:MAG TPA: 8-amino-7-oxononanoate synthase, partial [Gammaproteobacteria bacterium]|nr:8-amino-7-oxononanoate synthase [Gammaproteobacteria bacterium]